MGRRAGVSFGGSTIADHRLRRQYRYDRGRFETMAGDPGGLEGQVPLDFLSPMGFI